MEHKELEPFDAVVGLELNHLGVLLIEIRSRHGRAWYRSSVAIPKMRTGLRSGVDHDHLRQTDFSSGYTCGSRWIVATESEEIWILA